MAAVVLMLHCSSTVGEALGIGFGDFLFGMIAEYGHWKLIFYLTSCCGCTWFLFWYMLIYDFPHEHPKITLKEKEYITHNLEGFSAIIKVCLIVENTK